MIGNFKKYVPLLAAGAAGAAHVATLLLLILLAPPRAVLLLLLHQVTRPDTLIKIFLFSQQKLNLLLFNKWKCCQ